MLEEFRQVIPPSSPAAEEILISHQLAFQFRREVEYREEFKNYCQWYRETAAQHQEELRKMQGDINIFRCFLGNSIKG